MRDYNVYLNYGLKNHNDDIDGVLAMVPKSHAGIPTNSASPVWTAWDGIAEMFNQSYWHKVWIYQEATTPRHIYFIYSNYVFDDILLSATTTFGIRFSTIPGFDVKFIESPGKSSGVVSLSMARLKREKRKSQ